MNKTTQVSLASICSAVIIFNFTSCKYEEGPKITLKSKDSRLAGTWTATIIEGKAVDSTITLVLDFDKEGAINAKSSYSYSYYGITYTYSYDQNGTWTWNDDKSGFQAIIGEGQEMDTLNVEILRLTSKEMKFKDLDAEDVREELFEFTKE